MSSELEEDIQKAEAGLSPETIGLIRMHERIELFEKFRHLIYLKEFENDQIAADVLGWAYEKLAD